MSVIIRLQNLPWSANALDIRNFFRGLSIPEGGVHIVGGELGDAFIAFSTDEDARQAMMLDCGKLKEIQVRLLLSSRSEMHKVIETARQTVPILSLAPPAPAPAPTPAPAPYVPPRVAPFPSALSSLSSAFNIPGLGNPQEIPQPAVIEPPAPLLSPPIITANFENDVDESSNSEKKDSERKRSKEKDRKKSRSRSRSRSRDKKDRKRDRRDRSRSRDRRRRDRSRSRERRDRKRDRRSRSRDRSPARRSRDKRGLDRKSPTNQPFSENQTIEIPNAPPAPTFGVNSNIPPQLPQGLPGNLTLQNGVPLLGNPPTRFNDPGINDAFRKLQELGNKRNPNAFQGDQPQNGRGGGMGQRSGSFRREARSRFDDGPRDYCVAIRNAPNHTSYGDVRRFFPFMIDKHGIKMINDSLGRRTGNIFVRFCDPRSKQLALQRQNNELKGETVIVEALADDIYDSAVDSFLPFRAENDEEEPAAMAVEEPAKVQPAFSVIRLAELPHYVKEHDIIKLFNEFSLLAIILSDCRATRTKTALVQFAKPQDAHAAYEARSKYTFGRRPAVVSTVTDEEFELERSQDEGPRAADVEPASEPEVSRDPRQRRPPPAAAPAPSAQPQFFGAPFVPPQAFPPGFPQPAFPAGFPGGAPDPRAAAARWAARPGVPRDLADEPLDCVLMKGLPRGATDRAIVSFLSDTGAVPARIHLMLDPNGSPSGDCFCEFRSVQEARLAASKHGQDLDGCRVTVDLVPRGVVEEALEGPKRPESGEGLLGNVPPAFFEPSNGAPPFGNPNVPRGGFRGRGNFNQRGGFDSMRGGFKGNRNGFDGGRGGFEGGRGGFDGGRGGFDGGRNMFEGGRGGFEGRGGYRGRGNSWNDNGGFEGRGRGRGFGRGRGGFDGGRGGRGGMAGGGDMGDEVDPALESFGSPGCIVSMENVPFRATVEEILDFFAEFELSQDDVIRRYNERGQPTGDARVSFRTPFDAQRAAKTKNMGTIHERRINLSLL